MKEQKKHIGRTLGASTLLAVLLGLITCGCGGTHVKVNGMVKSSAGSLIADATVSITGDPKCCAADQLPCIYQTDSSGSWNISFAPGHLGGAEVEIDASCSYSVNKSGFTTQSVNFNYCQSGKSCSTDQTVTTSATLTAAP